MNIVNFTPGSALVGGALVGLSATLFLLSHGKVAGISGLYGGLFLKTPDRRARLAFVVGLALGGLALLFLRPASFASESPVPLPMVALGGLIVGYGTRLGNGCTSGHGVCGVSRLSVRSLAATFTFLGTGFATVAILQKLAIVTEVLR